LPTAAQEALLDRQAVAIRTEIAPTVIDLRDSKMAARQTQAIAPATGGAVQVRIELVRSFRIWAVGILAILNVADLITTRMFLDRGFQEGNGLSSALLQNGTMPWLKTAILVGLGWSAVKAPPKLGATCAMWFVTGLYAMVITVNTLALLSL
jgi:hypothetical protein